MKFFLEKIDSNLKKLYIHRAITFIAIAFANSFSVMFLYELFDNSYQIVVWFFLISGIISVILTPLSGIMINKIGFKRMLTIGSISRIALWISYFLTSLYNLKLGIILIFISLVSLRFFYWVPYHTEFSLLSKKNDRTKSIAFMQILRNILDIVSPVIAGAIITYFSFSGIYMIGIFFLFFALYPIQKMDILKEEYEWNYLETFQKFFRKKNRKFLLASFAKGAESLIGVVLWPIFIFIILEGDYLKIGFITTIVTLVVISIDFYISKKVDKNKNGKFVIKYGSIFHAGGWIFKIFVTSAFHIFIVDIYHRISKTSYTTPYNALMYDYVIDQGHYVDEYTVLREIAFRAGQTIMAGIVLILTPFVSINSIFILAALSTLLINFIPIRNNTLNK